MNTHSYALEIEWTGNLGTGTSGYREYKRSHLISAQGKVPIQASSDPAFRGDASAYNPEELLVASISSCHMLWFLHLCADAGIVVNNYTDKPIGLMEEGVGIPGRFTTVTLRPKVGLVNKEDAGQLQRIHEEAHKLCFIANSVNFPVTIEL